MIETSGTLDRRSYRNASRDLRMRWRELPRRDKESGRKRGGHRWDLREGEHVRLTERIALRSEFFPVRDGGVRARRLLRTPGVVQVVPVLQFEHSENRIHRNGRFGMGQNRPDIGGHVRFADKRKFVLVDKRGNGVERAIRPSDGRAVVKDIHAGGTERERVPGELRQVLHTGELRIRLTGDRGGDVPVTERDEPDGGAHNVKR